MELLPQLALLICAVAITAVARKRSWPAPLLVTGVALAVSFIPGIPDFAIEPEVILTLVLPPLLYSAALEVSFQNFAKSRKSISQLGVGLVVVTALVVGGVAYWLIPDMSLPAAFLLGAIVAPPDAVSAASIGRRLGLPRHVMTLLSGESLINDAASLTLFKVFLAIIGGATLTFMEDVGIFALAVGVGVLVGLLLGVCFHWLRMRVNDPVIETLMGLLLPFVAYIGAEHLSGSGVLAVVAAGLAVGANAPKTGYAARLQERPVWASIDVLLEGFVFALIGLQFKTVVESLVQSDRGVGPSIGVAVAVLAVVILIRPIFVFATYHLGVLRSGWRAKRETTWGEQSPRAKARLERRPAPPPPMNWRELTVVSWTSMRGVVTLAAAASVPVLTESGVRVPARDSIVFIAFAVTIGTLWLQGLTLPTVIRRLGVSDPGQEDRDRAEKRAVMQISVNEAVDYLDKHREELAKSYGDRVMDRATEVVRRQAQRQAQLNQDEQQEDHGLALPDLRKVAELQRRLIIRQREILVRERDAGTIDEEVMRDVLMGLDAQELALDTSPNRIFRS